MLRDRIARLFLAVLLSAVPAPAQRDGSPDVLAAVDRWERAFLAGKIDVTDPKPIDRDAPPRLPPRLLAHSPQRLTELQALEVLLRAAAEENSPAAAERLLRLAAIGLEPRSAKLTGAVIVRGVAEAALDECSSAEVHALLLDVATSKGEGTAHGARRAAAVRALGGSGQAVFWPVLTELLNDADEQLRAIAACALGDLGQPRAIGDLALALSTEDSPTVATAVVQALRELLVVAERNGELDPLLHQQVVRAAATALTRAADWRAAAEMVRFLERHRGRDAVPALIEVLARCAAQDGAGKGEGTRGATFLRAEAHRALKAMTGAVLGAEDVAGWRALWQTSKDSLKIVPLRREALPDNATVTGGFFGIPVLGKRVVFILDRSGSMVAPAPQPQDTLAGGEGTPTRLDVARRECWNAIKDLGPETYVNLIVFSDRARAWRDDLVPATPANKNALRNFLQGLIADGSTNLWEALSTGMKMRTAVTASRYREPVDEIFLLSDGYPSSGEITDAATIAARVAEQNRHTGIRLNTVFIGAQAHELDRYAQPGGSELMKVLAAQNQGTFVER